MAEIFSWNPEDCVQLERCPDNCDSDLAYPVLWQENDNDTWDVQCRCPNCGGVGEVATYDEATTMRFSNVLDHGYDEICKQVRQLERANMEEYVEKFVQALSAGHIFPEDF